MTQLQKFNELILDQSLLSLSSNSMLRRKYIDSFLTKELLEELYSIHGFTSNYICEEILLKNGYKTTAGSLIERARKLGIATPSHIEAVNNKLSQTKKQQTCIERFGNINPLCKGTESFKKRNQSIQDKYGVSNVFQLESVKVKSKQTLFDKYGVSNPIDLPSYKRNNGRVSSIHKKVADYLFDINILFELEKGNLFKAYNKVLQREYNPIVDIIVENKKIVIEINGDYYHANPNKYKSTDILYKWKGHQEAKEIWEFDKQRKEQIESFGYTVLVLWESDIRNNFSEVQSKLNEAFKN